MCRGTTPTITVAIDLDLFNALLYGLQQDDVEDANSET